jgi:hypothetical protein
VPQVVAGFSTRHGGTSAPPYDSLNLSLSPDDDADAVRSNRRRLFGQVGFSVEDLALAGQVHGNRVEHVTAPGAYRGVDGLVTVTPGVMLCMTAADCAAVLLADAEAGVVGACHAGWRGTVARVVPATVTRMQDLGARPGRLRAYVSPCIGVESFEVGPEVAAQFDDAFVVRRPAWPKPHVDLKAAIVAQLDEAGVPAAQIEVSPHDTAAEIDLFFSHRAEDGVTGRMMGFIGLRKDAAIE